jgi:hypothetical protein
LSAFARLGEAASPDLDDPAGSNKRRFCLSLAAPMNSRELQDTPLGGEG